MANEYFYIIQNEDGTSVVEYESNASPPYKGKILNLTSITREHGYVEVLEVEEIPAEGHTVVRVTVGPVQWQPEW
jgi:hypothetical protein